MDSYILRDRASEYKKNIPENSTKVFNAMNHKDLAVTVRVARKIFTKNGIPYFKKIEKSDAQSQLYRVEGNKAYIQGNYQKALMFYNKALLFAVSGSSCAKLAIANRSAISHKLKAYASCVSDIDRVGRMGCPNDLNNKLRMRFEDCKEKVWVEKLIDQPCFTESCTLDRLFEMPEKNPQIRSISKDIGVIIDGEWKTIAAARDIKVGTIIGTEKASISQLCDTNKLLSCSYCHKFTIPLIPCRKCTDSLYCDEKCLRAAFEEYHDAECHITNVLQTVPIPVRMAFKAVAKIKKQVRTWNNFIPLSFEHGIQQYKKSSVSEVYNEDSPHSLLCLKDHKHIVHGQMYNLAFDIVKVVEHMDLIPNYMPSSISKKLLVMSAIDRIMMALCLYAVPTLMPVIFDSNGEMVRHNPLNYGWFAFTSKLRNNCNPNVLPLVMHKKVMLVAIQPIRRGTEITIPYLGHWIDNPMNKGTRRRTMFALTGNFCDCVVCRDTMIDSKNHLSDLQLRNLRRLNLEQIKETFSPETIPIIYPKLCKALAFFTEYPFSKEYKEIFRLFRKCLHHFQTVKCPQFFMDVFDGAKAHSFLSSK